MTAALYTHHAADGSLLYVGASLNPIARQQQHQGSPWFKQIRSISLTWFDTLDEALQAEKQAIKSLSPKYNCRYGRRKRGAIQKQASGYDNSALVERIAAHLAETGEKKSNFGKRVANDASLFSRLVNGHEPRKPTLEKIEAALAAPPLRAER